MMRLDKAGGALLEAERKKQSPKLHQHPGAAAYAPERLQHRTLAEGDGRLGLGLAFTQRFKMGN